MGDSIFNSNRNKATVLLLTATIFLTAALSWVSRELYLSISREKALTSENRQLQAALEKEREQKNNPPPDFDMNAETVETREIAYVPKENEDTDVEINSSKNISVKVNGKTAEIKPEVQENYKFENGKLVVTESSEMKIRIDAPKRSRWTGTYLHSLKDNRHGIGISYALGHEVSLSAMYVADRAYLGLTFPIGSFR